jgi:hypothetical protein
MRRKEEKKMKEEETKRIQDEEVRRKAPNPGSGRRTVGLLAALDSATHSAPPPTRGLSANSNGFGSTYDGASHYAASEHPEVPPAVSRDKEKKRFWERGSKEDKVKVAQERERERDQERSLKEKALQREREKEKQRVKEREREREEKDRRKEFERQERERQAHMEDHPADLTRMIGRLFVTLVSSYR